MRASCSLALHARLHRAPAPRRHDDRDTDWQVRSQIAVTTNTVHYPPARLFSLESPATDWLLTRHRAEWRRRWTQMAIGIPSCAQLQSACGAERTARGGADELEGGSTAAFATLSRSWTLRSA